MLGLILILAVTLMHAYVQRRVLSVPFFSGKTARTALLAGGSFLWGLFLASLLFDRDQPGMFVSAIEWAGMTWMGVLLLTVVPLLAVDLITGFGMLLPRQTPSLRSAALLCGAALSLIALVQGTRPPAVRSYDVELRGLPAEFDGTVLVGLSDLHIGATLDGTWLKERIAQVHAEHPDMVVLLGDIVEGHGRPAEELAAALSALQAPMGVWAVLGNHEIHSDGPIVSKLGEAGIAVLRNERAAIRPGLSVAGVDDLTAQRLSGKHADLVARALAPPQPGATILLSHTPWDAEGAARAGAGLMLCGHTHGGQLWPYGYLVKRFYPLLAGRYEVGEMTVIVTRGAGTWGPRMRLWEPGEILRITLKAGKKGV